MRATSNGAGGVAHLVDVQTVDGNLFYWSDRDLAGVPAAITADGSQQNVTYTGWMTQAPTFQRYRSLQTDTGSFRLQNVFGDTLATVLERSMRKATFEGAAFVYRWWAVAAEMADLEIHGTLSVGDISNSDVEIKATSSFDASNRNAPEWQFTESCQLVWGLKRCGSTQAEECFYGLQTCQVIERYVGITNTYYDKNFAAALASVAQTPINRRRVI